MSTSTGTKKNRKDFGFAASVASSVGLPSEEIVSEEILMTSGIETKSEENTEEMPAYEPRIEENNPEFNTKIQEPATTEKPELVEVEPIPDIEFEEAGEFHDDIDKILSLSRNTHGVQKSVYLDEDIYLYIQDKCEKNKAKFSTVINLLLRKYINGQK